MNRPEHISYTVRRGDTLTRLARRYRTSVELMLAENAHLNPDILSPGEMISICPGFTELPKEPRKIEAAADQDVWHEPPRAETPPVVVETPVAVEAATVEAPVAVEAPASVEASAAVETPAAVEVTQPEAAEAVDVWHETPVERAPEPPPAPPPEVKPEPPRARKRKAPAMPYEILWPEAEEMPVPAPYTGIATNRMWECTDGERPPEAAKSCVDDIWECTRVDCGQFSAAMARAHNGLDERTLNGLMLRYFDALKAGIAHPPEPCSEAYERLCGDLRGYAQGAADYMCSKLR